MFSTIKTLPVIAIVFGIASAAHADTAMEFAFTHFNDSAESADDIRTVPNGNQSGALWVYRSTLDASPMSEVIRRNNEAADTPADLRGVQGVTIVNGTHSPQAAEIFRRLAEEDDD